ncbi:MAG TPA: hypothetical protein DEU95_00150 [Chloroflexi bacterium]|nr:hypothetical protein [Chloroflexota bacterium]
MLTSPHPLCLIPHPSTSPSLLRFVGRGVGWGGRVRAKGSRTTVAAEHWRPGPAFGLILSHFALFGIIAGVRGVVWAEMVDALRIGSGAFGTAQLAASFASIAAVVLYARVAARTGTRSIALVGLALITASMLGLAGAGSLATLIVALAILGAGTGLLDGAMIQGSVDWERLARRARMNVMHAGFSIAAVVGAIGAGIGLAAGASYNALLVGAAGFSLLTFVATLFIAYPPTGESAREERGDWRGVLASGAVRTLIGIILFGIVVESVAFIWAVIYLREELGASAAAGGASFALFNATMFAGRLANTPLVARSGPRVSLLASGIGIGAGGLLLVVAGSVPLAMAALALVGLGVAGIFPTVMSAAAARLPDRSRELTAVVMIVTYLAFMVTPPAIGWVAELSSLRIAMILLPVSGGAIVWLAARGREMTQA